MKPNLDFYSFDCTKAAMVYINPAQRQSVRRTNAGAVINTSMDMQTATSRGRVTVMTATVEHCTV